MSSIPIGSLYRNVTPLRIYKIPSGGLFIVSKGSVVGFQGDAIVNAANETCIIGGGVDGAIAAAGGPVLQNARKELPIVEGKHTRCPCGSAVITPGGNLKSSYCIHAVGPDYNSMHEGGDEKLSSAYTNALARAHENGLKTIGFSLISCGVYRGNKTVEHVLRIGVEAIKNCAFENFEEVHMCAFTSQEVHALENVCDDVFLEN